MARRRSVLGWAMQRRAVLDRSGGRCERCGLSLAHVWECHHRKLRSQGGDDSVCNLIALHMGCHSANESGSVHHSPAAAYAAGYLVRSRQDPRDVPVLLYGRRWVLLEPTGVYTPTERPS